jgi:hypothetical protein
MLSNLSPREELDMRKVELLKALENHKNIFSSPFSIDPKLQDIRVDFHNIIDRTHDFINVAIKHIEELEKSRKH